MLGFLRRKAVAWEVIVAQLGEANVVEPGHEVHGVLDGVPVRLRFERATQLTTIATTLPFERFSLVITPRAEATDFELAFEVIASPTDLPRLVIDDYVRTRLLAIEPRPTLRLDPPELVLEARGFLDAQPAIAGLEAVAHLARLLGERAAMCARG